MSDVVFGGRSDICSTNLGGASVGTPDIRPPPQTISYTKSTLDRTGPVVLGRAPACKGANLARGAHLLRGDEDIQAGLTITEVVCEPVLNYGADLV